MTTLAQQIEALRRTWLIPMCDEMYLVTRLAAEIAQRDAEMMREVEAILLAHELRRADIVRALHTLAARIGHVPPPQPLAAHPIDQPPPHMPMPRMCAGIQASSEVH
jgi:hypothetical protein